MANMILKSGYKKEYILSVLNLLSTYHDIETIYEKGCFKGLDWNISVPETNSKTIEISIHNFSILKEQILMNQHNPLYNAEASVAHPIPIRQNRYEEIRKELIFNLQNLKSHKKALENDCKETKQYINSLINLNLIHENIHSKIIWNNSLYAKEVKSFHMEKNIQKSYNQLEIIKKLEDLRKTNKLWYKLIEEEKNMLNKISLNCYMEKLSYESVRKVVKKEIWKRALNIIKLLTHKEDAVNAKQLLFYFRFGSSNKIKQKLPGTIKR
jgi:hypothetical protein